MIYLEWFTFPDSEKEFDFFLKQKRTCYDSYYPFQILSRHHFRRIDFAPVTILYGGNGTGKTVYIIKAAAKISKAKVMQVEADESEKKEEIPFII